MAEMPASVWHGEMSLFGVKLHLHVLDDGRRIVEAADMAALQAARLDRDHPETSERPPHR